MKLLTLQFLRGLAAIVVVLYHTHGLIVKRSTEFGAENVFWLTENQFIKIGAIGVDIFFVLSGFIIFYTSRNSTDLILYIKKRLTRIYPIWFVAIFFMSLIALIPSTSATFEWRHVLNSALLIPHYIEGRVVPFLQIGWTLYYEVIFYFLFAVVLIITKTKRLELITAIIFLLWLFSITTNQNTALFSLLENPVLFEFVIGGWLAKFYIDDNSLSQRQMLFLIVFALIWMLMFFLTSWLWKCNSLISRAPIAIVLFISAVFYVPIRDAKVHKLFVYLGDASYSIYLFHMFPIMVISGVLKKIELTSLAHIPVIISCGVVFIISVLFGCVMYSVVEKKINNALKFF